MRNKKGVEMSLNVVIIAAVGLLILLILAYLVVTYVAKTRVGLESCTVSGHGICMDPTTCTARGGQAAPMPASGKSYDCEGSSPACCVLIPTK